MSENNEDIDDFIEYELTKEENCDDIEECDDVVECLETEDEDDDNDPPKSSLILQHQIIQSDSPQISYLLDGQLIKQELGDKVVHLSNEGIDSKPIVFDGHAMVEDMGNDEEYAPTTSRTNTTTTTTHQKGPKRYMLFDDLVANIVDYDDEGTPIVEFAMSTERDEILPVECGICPDVMHKTKLTKHLKTHLVSEDFDKGNRRYQCIYCDETYKEHKYLAGHARRHMGIRPYVCEPCKLYFSTKQDLRVHNQRRHMAREHVCEFCGKTFPQNTQLKRHRESTHEKKRRFPCPHCTKAYYKNFTLQEHIRHVHMGKRRVLTCPFCGFECHDAHKMARHRKTYHLNQTHFECTICQEEFTDINYFDAHKRSIQCKNNTRRKQEMEASESLQDSQQEMEAEHDGQEYQHYHDDSGVLVPNGDGVLMLEPQQIVEFDGTQQELMDGQLVYEITIGN